MRLLPLKLLPRLWAAPVGSGLGRLRLGPLWLRLRQI